LLIFHLLRSEEEEEEEEEEEKEEEEEEEGCGGVRTREPVHETGVACRVRKRPSG
jgi:hypothetical protein